MRTPTWGAIIGFCAADGWTPDRQSKHIFYEKTLPDGTGLQTHVPHGKQGQAIGPDLFHFILRTQLEVSAAEFWDTVEHKRDEALRLLEKHWSQPKSRP